MELLTGGTMTVFRIQRLLPAQLVLDLATVTAGFIASVEVWVVIMDLVGCPELPLIVVAISTSLIAVVTIGAVCRSLFGHEFCPGVELNCVTARESSGCWTNGSYCEVELTGT